MASFADQLYSLLKSKGYWNGPFSITLIIKVHEGKEKQLIEAMHKVTALTLKETGVITYEFSQDLSDPKYFVLKEKWRDGPSFKHHLEQAYTTEFMSSTKDITTSEFHLSGPLKPAKGKSLFRKLWGCM